MFLIPQPYVGKTLSWVGRAKKTGSLGPSPNLRLETVLQAQWGEYKVPTSLLQLTHREKVSIPVEGSQGD